MPWEIEEYDLRRKPGTNGTFIVGSELRFRSVEHRVRVCACDGWETDGASIPPAVRWWASPFAGAYTAAAIIHDAMYRVQHPGIDREKADEIFLEAMLASDVRRSQAYTIYGAVRAFGWIAWNGNQEDAPYFRERFFRLQPA